MEKKSKYARKVARRRALAIRLGVSDMPFPCLWALERKVAQDANIDRNNVTVDSDSISITVPVATA